MKRNYGISAGSHGELRIEMPNEKSKAKIEFKHHNRMIIVPNLVPRVSHLTAPRTGRGGKMRDPGNEVA